MLGEQMKSIFLYLFVLAILNLYYGYRVEMTINDGKNSRNISEFEIVNHDNPPFETEEEGHMYKDEMNSFIGEISTNHDTESDQNVHVAPAGMEGRNENKMTQDGVKVSGFLGNVRHKRSLDQLSHQCMIPEGDSTVSDKAVTAETGETVHLPCHKCTEDETEVYRSMEWVKLYQYPNAEGLYLIKEVVSDTHDDERLNRISLTLDHTLVIKKAKLSDAGSYFCEPSDKTGAFMNIRLDWNELQEYIADESHMRYYFHVDVIDLNHADTIDVSSYSKTKPTRPEVVPHLNIVITTRWHPWTSCSVCGDDGIRKRMGVCFVRKHDSSRPVPHNYLRNILNFAKNGVPCQSQFLRDFRREPWLQKPNQIQVEECNIPCKSSLSRRKKREVNILSKSELEDKNIQEALKGKSAKVKAKKKIIKIGSYFILKCPGISLTKTINWVNGSKLVHLIKIQKFSNNRITIDMFGNLHFKAAEFSDGGTYSCWIKKKMKQKYDITIKEDKSVEIIKYTVYLCISFGCDFIVFVALAVIKYLQRKVQHRKRVKETVDVSEEEADANTDGEADDESSSSEDSDSDSD